MTDMSTDTRLALLETAVINLKASHENNFKKMFRILEGEGDECGLKTSVKLQKASLGRLYKWVAALTLFVIAIIEEFIRRHLT